MSNRVRARGLQRERQEQGTEALQWSSAERVNRAGQLYLQMAELLPPDAIVRDMERRLRVKARFRCGLGQASS